MNEKGWNFLLEQQGSPLLDVGNVLHFFNVDVLSTAQRRKLIGFLREMEVCRYNRVILSCVCRPGERSSRREERNFWSSWGAFPSICPLCVR